MYKLFRNILFWFPTEKVHYWSMNMLKFLCSIGFKNIIRAIYTPRGDHQFDIFNVRFPNKVGLGAGFDKNAKYLRELECLGFGFVEIGTVTPLPQDGNKKPRLFRLPKDKALINRMGFNNDGVKVIVERLKKFRNRQPIRTQLSTIIGGNIGKNKSTPNEEAWKD